MSSSDAWCSPPEIADPLAQFFGGPVDTDPCSNERSIIQAVTAYSRGGLLLPWMGSVYENDPYSKAGIWTDKMLHELDVGNATELVRLSMMATSSVWWSRMCTVPRMNPRIVCTKRLYFLDPFATVSGQKRQGCRFEPALTYFGPRPAEFDKAFAHLARWSTWGR